MEKYYIPVEVIEKQIAFLKGLMETCGDNEAIQCVIKNLQIVNSHTNRKNSKDIYYSDVRPEFLKEDAAYWISEYLVGKTGYYPDDDELDKYDYEYLVDQFERRDDGNVSQNSLWEYVVEEYMEDFEEA